MNYRRFGACAGYTLLSLCMVAPVWAASAAKVERLYQEGVNLRLEGRPAEASVIFSQALALQPDHVDLLLQQGLALSASGRENEAVPVLERVLQLAPNYTDAQEALARIEARRLASQETASPAFVPTSSTEPRFRLDIGASHSHLSGDRPSWKEGGIRLAYKASPDTTLSAGVDISRRYNKTDRYGELRADHRLSERLSGYAYVGGTPNAHFLPKVAAGLGGQYRLNKSAGFNSTYALLNLRFARYNTGDTWSANAGLVQYLSEDRIWVTATSINTRDEKQRFMSGFSLRMDFQVKPDLRLLGGFANAPESSDGITLRTRTYFVGAVYDVSPVFGFNLNLSHEKLSRIYDRNTVSIGLTYRF
ncbi:MAG: YaiO family outer membrane beta-barrel protein [Advenella sp.]